MELVMISKVKFTFASPAGHEMGMPLCQCGKGIISETSSEVSDNYTELLWGLENYTYLSWFDSFSNKTLK